MAVSAHYELKMLPNQCVGEIVESKKVRCWVQLWRGRDVVSPGLSEGRSTLPRLARKAMGLDDEALHLADLGEHMHKYSNEYVRRSVYLVV